MLAEDIRTDDNGAVAEELRKGVIWFSVALAATCLTYVAAVDGQTFLVFWTVLMYGAYRLARGLYYRSNPDALTPGRSAPNSVD